MKNQTNKSARGQGPAATKNNASIKNMPTAAHAKPVELILPTGTKCLVKPFFGKDVITAQRMMGSDPEKFIFAMIAVTCTFDGKAVVMEDVEFMDGYDVLELMTYFQQTKNFQSGTRK